GHRGGQAWLHDSRRGYGWTPGDREVSWPPGSSAPERARGRRLDQLAQRDRAPGLRGRNPVSRRSRRSADDPSLPVVSLVGRPNVGKSSLFNRLVGGQPALVEDMPGVTRDRRYGACDWSGVRFRLTDTGGLDPGASGILGAMRSQTLRAV